MSASRHSRSNRSLAQTLRAMRLMRTLFSKSIGRMTVGVVLLCAPAPIVFSACTNLTEVPQDALTPTNAFKNEPEVLAGVASVYAQLRSMTDDRFNLSEVSTDE